MKFLRTEELSRRILRTGLAGLLLSPFFIWFFAIPRWHFVPWPEVLRLFGVTLEQASLSTVATVGLGAFLYWALQSWVRPDSVRMIESVLLLPNAFPPLFVAMCCLGYTDLWGQFPYGMGAVVVAHALLNSGLVALALQNLMQHRLGRLAEAAWTMGVRPIHFYRRVAWPLLRQEILLLTVFVFSIHLTSFSLPLLLGGSNSMTLEVGIFDAIRIHGRWDLALILAGLETLLVLGLATLVRRPFWPRARLSTGCLFLRSPAFARPLCLLPGIILLGGWLMGIRSFSMELIESEILSQLVDSVLLTVIIGLGAGLTLAILLAMIVFVSPSSRLSRFLNGYLAPSPAIAGFGLLLLDPDPILSQAMLILALALVTLPLLYRWLIHSRMQGLIHQVEVARSLGANWKQVFAHVTWPQMAPAVMQASGLAALWASGDFALAGILLNGEANLPLLIDDLMNRYQFEVAQLLLLPVLIIGIGLYWSFERAGRYVAG
ncbi:MAG: ABC transporter permease [Bdellovibrionales bacterium]